MGFLDSSSSIITAILTRKGRELIAKNSGEFRISKFALGDDEINYQLWDAATESDADILNLPVLEPSSNELTALRFRLLTMPQGSIQIAYLAASPASLVLQNKRTPNPSLPSVGTILVQTYHGIADSVYLATSRNTTIASVTLSPVPANAKEGKSAESAGIIQVEAGEVNGVTYIDISGRDSGAVISIPVTVTQITRRRDIASAV